MRVRCPECDARVKVPDDHDRPFIRCKSCNEKIPLDDVEPRKSPGKKASKSAAKSSNHPSFLAKYGFPLASVALVGLLAVVLLAGALFHEIPALIAFITGPLIALFAFIVACVLAKRDGHYIGFLDFLGLSEGLAILLLILFTGCYLSIFGLLWGLAILKSTFQKPKVYLPWLALYFMGFFIMLGIPIIHSFAKQAGMVIVPRPPDGGGPMVQGPKDRDTKRDRTDAAPKDVAPKDASKKDKEKAPEKLPPPPKVTGDETIDRALADLSDKDRAKIVPAAESLNKMTPNKHRAIVAQKLAEQLPTAPPYERRTLIRALGAWGTAAEVPMIIPQLNEKDAGVQNEALVALGKLKDARASAPIVRCLYDLTTRANAEGALRSIGPPAEKDVLTLFKQKDILLQHLAVRLLHDIGTQQSVPTLQVAARGPIELQDAAQQALKAIASRKK